MSSKKVTMTDDLLREANGNSLTMSMIGCLPDNVQQSIQSFAIKQGKQHLTLSFSFMAEMIRHFRSDSLTNDQTASVLPALTPALFFDHSVDVIEGYHTYITLAPLPNRISMPIVMLTLYETNTTEGIVKHFESIAKIIYDTRNPNPAHKLPLMVVDLPPLVLESVIDACTQILVDLLGDSLETSCGIQDQDNLKTYISDKMVKPYFRSYNEHFRQHMKEVTRSLQVCDPDRFFAVMTHLRSITCTAVDFQKADLMMKSQTTEPMIKCFWHIWGQEQLACKVFPIAIATRNVSRSSLFIYHVNGTGFDTGVRPFTHVPIKEGLQSIIKCLKAQEVNSGYGGVPDKMGVDRNPCSCGVCRVPGKMTGYNHGYKQHFPYWDPKRNNTELFPSHSAFCRPQASTDLLQDNYLRMSLMSQAASWSPYLGSSGQGHLSDPWNYFLSNSGSFRSTQSRNSKLVCPTVYKPKAISLKSLQKVYNEVKRY